MKRIAVGLLASIATTAMGFSFGELAEVERPRFMKKAESALSAEPRTVTADRCERSAGGIHDFFSEGDYWWPDPKNPEGPYVQRDGMTNPENFIAHRESMIRLSELTGTLVSAWMLTKDAKYADAAGRHLEAWFVNPETKMNPSLLYGQAIKGRETGRSIGVIDTIHLVEVAQGAKALIEGNAIPAELGAGVKAWFAEYLHWINSHEYGLKEKQAANNHGVTWSLQAAAFASFTGDEELLDWIREQFKKDYIGRMMDPDGSFPAELARTKPYWYSLFVIDAVVGVALFASSPEDDLWNYQHADGRSLKLGLEFIAPLVADKTKWKLKPDVLYWDEWPVRHPSMLLGGLRFERPQWLSAWAAFDPDPKTFEVLRNLPMRHPLLWVK